jgi:hypothetical protein
MERDIREDARRRLALLEKKIARLSGDADELRGFLGYPGYGASDSRAWSGKVPVVSVRSKHDGRV